MVNTTRLPRTRVLLLYSRFLPTYWGMQYSLPVLGKKSIMPPLGLLTLAALSPPEFEFRLVDENCAPLSDADLEWAELVCISAMQTQKNTAAVLADRCRAAGKTVVMGGPYPTASPEECLPHCDVLVAGEAEITWPLFLEDYRQGTLQREYRSDEKPDIQLTPTPRFDLIRSEDYFTIPIQFSRGCPFQCEFCDIIVMFGRKPRTKSSAQIRRELSAVYDLGYRGDVFFVDDNFIGNKRKTQAILETVQEWNQDYGHPFEYTTEASVDLAEKPELLKGMVDAHFRRVFVGIESPSAASLEETKKFQNMRNSLEDSVNTIASAGLNVMAGFIVGFDSDPVDICQQQIDLISRLPIPLAMVARLEAAPGTPLYARMKADGRLIPEKEGHTPGRVGTSNIAPLGSPVDLLRDYGHLLETIYAPKAYFARVLDANRRAPRPRSFRAGLKTLVRQVRMGANYTAGPASLVRFFASLRPDFRREAARLFLALLRERPDRLGLFLAYVIVGDHMNKYTFELVLDQIRDQLRELEASTPSSPTPAPRPLPVVAS